MTSKSTKSIVESALSSTANLFFLLKNGHDIVKTELILQKGKARILVHRAARQGRANEPWQCSDLLEILKHGIDHFEGLIDLLADLCTGQDNLATDEDQKYDLRFDHSVDQTRKQLRLVRAEVVMTGCKTLQPDRELDVTGANNILDLKVRELRIETQLLNDARILSRGQLGIVFRLCASHDHLAGSKDKSSSLWLTNSHNDGSETLWIVFSVSRMQGDRLQIQTAIEIDRGNDVLQGRNNTADTLSRARSRSRSGGCHPIASVCLTLLLLLTVRLPISLTICPISLR